MKANLFLATIVLAIVLPCDASGRLQEGLVPGIDHENAPNSSENKYALIPSPSADQWMGPAASIGVEGGQTTTVGDNPPPRHLALGYALNGNYGAALALLDHGLSIDHGNASLLAGRADVLSWKGDLAGATVELQKAVKSAPKVVEYWLKLADLYAWNGRTAKAIEAYREVLRLAPANVDADIGLARIYRSNHQYAAAGTVLREGLAKDPGNERLTSALAELAADQSLRPKEVVEVAEVAIFWVILAVMSLDAWRERRVLRRRQLVYRVLLPAIIAMTLLCAITYIRMSLGGLYYQEFSVLAQIIEPVVLGTMLAIIVVWRLRYKRPVRQRTILAIGAHPDDIEFGCGATILRLREEGAATYGLVMTGGEKGHDNKHEGSVRVKEACSAANVMALCDITFHDFPDTLLHEHKTEIREAIEAAIARWRPDIIFTHNSHDVHTDHQVVFDATREAARGAYTVLCYENPNTPPSFRPGYFFDVGEHIDGKIAALARHKTQRKKPYAASAVIRAMAGFRGSQARVLFAEGFEVMRVLEKSLHQ